MRGSFAAVIFGCGSVVIWRCKPVEVSAHELLQLCVQAPRITDWIVLVAILYRV